MVRSLFFSLVVMFLIAIFGVAMSSADDCTVPTGCGKTETPLALTDEQLTGLMEKAQSLGESLRQDPSVPGRIDVSQQDRDLVEQLRVKVFREAGVDPYPIPAEQAAAPTDGRMVYVFLTFGEKSDIEMARVRTALEFVSRAGVQSMAVFRGMPKGAKTLSDFFHTVATVVKGITPQPNVSLDPEVFSRFAVTDSPVMILTANDRELSRVAGVMDPDWLAGQQEQRNFGVQGDIRPVLEQDFFQLLQERTASIDFKAKFRSAYDGYWANRSYQILSPALEAREFSFEPAFVVSKDITAQDGTVIARAGEEVKPLDRMPLPPRFVIIVFNPSLPGETKLAQGLAMTVKEPYYPMFVITEPPSKSWDGFQELVSEMNSRVYVLTSDMVSGFRLEHTPCVVTAEGSSLVVREYPAEGVLR